VQDAFLIQAGVFILSFALGHRAFVFLVPRFISHICQGIPGVEAIEAHAQLLDDVFPVFEVYFCPAWAVGGVVSEVALIEVAPMIARGLQVLTYPTVWVVTTYAIGPEVFGGRVVGTDHHVLVVGVHSSGGFTELGPTCVSVGRGCGRGRGYWGGRGQMGGDDVPCARVVYQIRGPGLGFYSGFGDDFDDFFKFGFAVLLDVVDLVAHGEGEIQGNGVKGRNAECHGLEIWSPVAQVEDLFYCIFVVKVPVCGMCGVCLYHLIRQARCFFDHGEPVVIAGVRVAEGFLEKLPSLLNIP
jgi:hypothetical protein